MRERRERLERVWQDEEEHGMIYSRQELLGSRNIHWDEVQWAANVVRSRCALDHKSDVHPSTQDTTPSVHTWNSSNIICSDFGFSALSRASIRWLYGNAQAAQPHLTIILAAQELDHGAGRKWRASVCHDAVDRHGQP